MQRLSLHELTTIDEPALQIQCVEGSSRFVLFRRGLSVWDLEDSSRPKQLSRVYLDGVPDEDVRACVSDDGTLGLLRGAGRVELWDLAGSTPLATCDRMGTIEAALFVPRTHAALFKTVRTRDDLRAHATVLLHIDTNLMELPAWGHRWWSVGRIRGLALPPEPGRIILAGVDFGPAVYSTASGDLVHTLPARPFPMPEGPLVDSIGVTGVLSACAAEVCIVVWGTWGNRRHEIAVWNTKTGEPIAHIPWAWQSHHGRILGSMSPDGKLLGLTGDEGAKGASTRVVRVIDLSDGAVIRTWAVGDRINTFSMLPDGAHALTSSEHRLAVWNLEQDEPVFELELTSRIDAWAISARGLLLASTDDGKLHAYVAEGYTAPSGIDSERSEIWV
jgi:WD40 repeat protein